MSTENVSTGPIAPSVEEAMRRPSRFRVTPLSARGESMVWIMGMTLVVCCILIFGLLGRVVFEGMSTFWPRPIVRVKLADGGIVQGVRTREQVDAATGAPRFLVRVGNRELGTPFVWVEESAVKERSFPADAVLLERKEWGVWVGTPEAVLKVDVVPNPGDKAFEASGMVDGQPVTRRKAQLPDGSPAIETTSVLAQGSAAAWEKFNSLHPQAVERSNRIANLTGRDLGRINNQIDGLRLKVRQAEIDAARTAHGETFGLSWGAWSAVLASTLAAAFGIRVMRGKQTLMHSALSIACAGVVVLGVFAVTLEGPWRRPGTTQEQLAAVRATCATERTRLEAAYQRVLQQIDAIKAEDQRYRFVVKEPSGRFAPTRQTAPDDPMLISQVVRAVPANQLSVVGRVGVYISRWAEFLGGEPREANTEGGVFPVIFGTVVMTVLLSFFVVPLGVVAAVYLREYARQGYITSAIRIAVNNLAGVPSIVYGVFGLGFFCYTIGTYIDGGPSASHAIERFPWWLVAGATVVLVGLAIGLGVVVRSRRGYEQRSANRGLLAVATISWLGAAVLVAMSFVTTPYFHGFFEAAQPSPTFGSRGLMWGSLTLALLTLPVVIVATEEAIAAVPKSMREGSYGAGASKWQTIWRIVLPQAMPGIMTGMILAMARGAGEVAPLMLVGAVKLAPDLPVSTQAPFIHPERSFMHLGFHIFDLGFQSPDSEAARPLVWTTTLLLIVIVLMLNFGAIVIRGRLRARMMGSNV